MKRFEKTVLAFLGAAILGMAVCGAESKADQKGFVKVVGSTVVGGTKFEDVYGNTGVFVPECSVAISTFYMSDHEVTQAEYEAVMGTTGETQENLPVEKVNWFDAIYYCNKKSLDDHLAACYAVDGKDDPSEWGYTTRSGNRISGTITCDFSKNGYRLPTEAEWEYATRGGKAGCEAENPTDFAGTDSGAELGKYAWFKDNSDTKTHAVKTEKQAGVDSANSLGLYDMSGNMWEWCWDLYNSSVTSNDSVYTVNGVVTNPAGASSGYSRVVRGGSWLNKADSCSIANRGALSSSLRDDILGFRVVRSAID